MHTAPTEIIEMSKAITGNGVRVTSPVPPTMGSGREEYEGLPKCQDCGWKLGTAITDNCSCLGAMTPEREKLHIEAFQRARRLQGGWAGADKGAGNYQFTGKM